MSQRPSSRDERPGTAPVTPAGASGGSPWFRVFWIWLLCAFAGQAALGYSVAFAIETPLWSWHQEPMAESLWSQSQVPALVADYRRHAMGMLGPTIASWAVALFFVTAVPFRRREPWAWWCIAVSLMAWFPFDTAVSMLEGVWSNVAFNVAGFAMTAIPLAATYRHVARHPSTSRASDASA